LAENGGHAHIEFFAEMPMAFYSFGLFGAAEAPDDSSCFAAGAVSRS